MLSVEFPLIRASMDVSKQDDAPLALSDAVVNLQHAKLCVPLLVQTHGLRAWERAASSVVKTLPAIPSPSGGLASRAYFKMWEILRSCAVPKTHRSLHLCEAPGGFVQAAGDWSECDWVWSAATLDSPVAPKPYGALPYDRGAFMHLPARGDVMSSECAHAIVEETRGDRLPDLVTADGAVEMDHERLEEAHLSLLRTQIDVALACLKPSGTLICKYFEGALPGTRCCIAALTTRFREVSVIKPSRSRSTNSERYIVAKGFEGDASPLPVSAKIVRSWTISFDRICDSQARTQEQALQEAIAHIQSA